MGRKPKPVSTTRLCRKCGVEKPIEEFRRYSLNRPYRRRVCWACDKARMREYYLEKMAADPEFKRRRAEYHKDYYKRNREKIRIQEKKRQIGLVRRAS